MYSYNPYYGQYLAHYGVLGMKWGVRRFQPYPSNYHGGGVYKGKYKSRSKAKIGFNDDIILKRGATAYRVTSNSDDKTNNKYVTIDQNDRNFYKSHWAKALQQFSGKTTYENTYTTQNDLISPSAKKRFEILQEISKNYDINKSYAIAQTAADARSYAYYLSGLNAKESAVAAKALLSNNPDGNLKKLSQTNKNIKSFYSDIKSKNAEKTLKDFINMAKQYRKEDVANDPSKLCYAMFSDETLKNKFFDKVKEKGYTCVIDDVAKFFDKKSVAPLIIFDSNETLSRIKSSPLGQTEYNKAYYNWSQTTNNKLTTTTSTFIKNSIPGMADMLNVKLSSFYSDPIDAKRLTLNA